MRDREQFIRTMTRELDLTERALGDWVRQAEVDVGRRGPRALMTGERNEPARLWREVWRFVQPEGRGGLLMSDSRVVT